MEREPTPPPAPASTSTSTAVPHHDGGGGRDTKDSGDSDGGAYRVKRIEFKGKTIPIITQNENGPCPLLAISNVLLLRGTMKIHLDYAHVKAQELLTLLSEVLFQTAAPSSQAQTNDDPTALASAETMMEQNVHDTVSLFPQLLVGLDVNVKFNSVNGFEFTRELTVFDMFRCTLVHGWLVDPQDLATHAAMRNLSYNQAVERVLTNSALLQGGATPQGSPASSNSNSNTNSPMLKQSAPARMQAQLLHQSTTSSTATAATTSGDAAEPSNSNETKLIARFLEETATQLTFHGLAELHQRIRDEDLCVFFRNNHFNTLYKHNGDLYILVTDQGYLHKPDLVWERLDALDGDTTLVDSHFSVYREQSLPLSSMASTTDGSLLLPPEMATHGDASMATDEDPSLALARQIQAEEDMRLARQLQESIDRDAVDMHQDDGDGNSDDDSNDDKKRRTKKQTQAKGAPATHGRPAKGLAKSSPANPVPPKGQKPKKDKDDDGCTVS